MGRSIKKKDVVKIRGHLKKIYWKLIRRIQKQDLNSGRDIRPKEVIVNNYDYVDYVSICEDDICYCIATFGRKKCLEK